MIAIECVYLKNLLECASFSLTKGSISAILTETDFEKTTLLKVFTGIIRNDSGRVSIFGKDIFSITYSELTEIRKRIGVVLNNGGLISNLKLWENIMLPLMYHNPFLSQDVVNDLEKRMTSILNELGFNNDELTVLSGSLPIYKKRLAGLARAMLMEPDLMMYDSVFDGLGGDIKEKTVKTIDMFHKKKDGRTSLFLASNEGLLNDIKADRIYILKNRKFHERN